MNSKKLVTKMNTEDLSKDILDKWKTVSEIVQQRRLSPMPFSARDYYLIFGQYQRNKFSYVTGTITDKDYINHNWSYYNSQKVTCIPLDKSLAAISFQDIRFDKLKWRSFQDTEYPKHNSLVIFNVWIDMFENKVYTQEKINIGKFKKSLFGSYLTPTIPIDILYTETKAKCAESTSLIINEKNRYKKIPFKAVYKWTYLKDLLDIIGDPMEFNLGLINYEKQY